MKELGTLATNVNIKQLQKHVLIVIKNQFMKVSRYLIIDLIINNKKIIHQTISTLLTQDGTRQIFWDDTEKFDIKIHY